ncbi:ABC exporter membrane fusion protein [Mastigocoleus testarum]|uniref:Hemolysin D n=1 Tax=Mastigocoleus testarum BC008 TaxID=371196 RepID=A0A0V7ZDE0_9CYAN|nr:ABC exporter membrane fusion protein [Mastigocoleus testarum]KST62483.1 hemolysin D [Mastigocoleus testarum BC008]
MRIGKRVFLEQQKWWAIAFIVASLTGGTAICYKIISSHISSQNSRENSSSISSGNTFKIGAVSARGLLEPEGELINLSAPGSFESARVSKLLVKEGTRVSAGQTIAILDSRDRLFAALEQAKKQIKVTQANLERVKAGAKIGEINAQQAKIARLEVQLRGKRKTQQAIIARLKAQLKGERRTQQAIIARLKAQLHNASLEWERYKMLHREGAVEASKFEIKRLDLRTTQEHLNEAQAKLDRIELTLQHQIHEAKATLEQTVDSLQEEIKESKATLKQIIEVRPTDIQVARAEMESAIANAQKAQAELDLAYVRAPFDSHILQIHTFPGELVGKEGIANLGQTENMHAVAEIYETDITQVKIGQRASVTSNAFSGKLHGEVSQIGLQIAKQNNFSTDPIADVDRRVIEVKIRLDPEDARKVKHLTNLQVEVLIDT